MSVLNKVKCEALWSEATLKATARRNDKGYMYRCITNIVGKYVKDTSLPENQ